MKTYILKLDEDDEQKEIEFELLWLQSLSIEERFELMFRKSEEIIDILGKDENRKSVEIIKRT